MALVPVKETVKIVLSMRNVVGYFPLEVGSQFGIVSGLHARVSTTIMVNMPMRRSYDIGKSNVVLKELSTTEEAMEIIQRIEDVPPKPPENIVEFIDIVHSIYY